jgi:hypothetical protein
MPEKFLYARKKYTNNKKNLKKEKSKTKLYALHTSIWGA